MFRLTVCLCASVFVTPFDVIESQSDMGRILHSFNLPLIAQGDTWEWEACSSSFIKAANTFNASINSFAMKYKRRTNEEEAGNWWGKKKHIIPVKIIRGFSLEYRYSLNLALTYAFACDSIEESVPVWWQININCTVRGTRGRNVVVDVLIKGNKHREFCKHIESVGVMAEVEMPNSAPS